MLKKLTKLSQLLGVFGLSRETSTLENRAHCLVFRPQIEVLESRWNPSAVPTMFDANLAGLGSRPESLVNFHGSLLFTADDGIHGKELWKTDGTDAGTFLLRDINPGSSESFLSGITKTEKELLFFANDGNQGHGLWKTDGTKSGTVLVKDLSPGKEFLIIGETLYFQGNIYFSTSDFQGSVCRLWKSDGTEAGTKIVKEIHTQNTSTGLAASNFVILKDQFFFLVKNSGGELDFANFWFSNGESDGTGIFLDRISVGNLASLNDTLLFSGYEPDHGEELWMSDGTREGSSILKEMVPGESSGYLSRFAVNQGTLFFWVGGLTEGKTELWKSDGTLEGTVLIREFDDSIGTPGGGLGQLGLGNSFYFSAYSQENGYELWKTDGSPLGTTLVKDILAGPDGSAPYGLTAFQSQVYFVAGDQRGMEIWKTDGTPSGTLIVKDILPGVLGSAFDLGPNSTPVASNDSLFFPANDGVHGIEIWKSDGTENGTMLFRDIRTVGNQSGFPRNIYEIKNKIVFTSIDGFNNNIIYGGDFNNFQKVMQFDWLSSFGNFTPFVGNLFFTVHGEDGTGLWKTDGTIPGTSLVMQFGNKRGNGPVWMTVFRGMLYFVADDGLSGAELWKSDGNPQGTVQVKDIFPGPEGGISGGLFQNGGSTSYAILKDILYFPAFDGIHGYELWRTDGTEAGTYLVKDINPGENGSVTSSFTLAEDYLFFAATSGTMGSKLWRTDGTDAGTVPIPNSNPREDYLNPTGISQVGDSIFFYTSSFNPDYPDFPSPPFIWKTDGLTGSANYALAIRLPLTGFIPFRGKYLFVGLNRYYTNGDHLDDRLFITDGTIKNTVPLKNLPDFIGYDLFDYAVIDDTFYFWDSGLWKSDGTPEGTVLVKSIPSDLNRRVRSLVGLDHKLYFRVIDSKGDPAGFLNPFRNDVDTLWVSDGTFSGTRPVAGFSSPEGFSMAAYGISIEISAFSGQLFFQANDGTHGNELWRLTAVADRSPSTPPLHGVQGAFEGSFPDWQSNFVAGLYKTIFNRSADKQELRHWVGLLSLGFSRDRVARAFLESREYRGIEVDSYFQRFLGRTADPKGREAWIMGFLDGLSESDIIQKFLNSPEYLAKWNGNVALIQGVYQDLLGRVASVQEVRHWNQLLLTRLDRRQMIALIIHSEEVVSNQIQSFYNNFLHRDMDAQGRIMVKRVVQQKSSFKEILNGIFSSPEFHHLTTV